MEVSEARLERLLTVVTAAFAGDLQQRLPIDDAEDPLLEVEVAINYLLDELEVRLDENLAQAQVLREQAQALVVALSTPIITLWPGVLILPLIGEFDRARGEQTIAVLLERVAADRARHVILDLTGVEAMSEDTMLSLLRITRSAKLLGVDCLVTGISPHVAGQFVNLHVDTSEMRTCSRVSDALEIVLRDLSKHR